MICLIIDEPFILDDTEVMFAIHVQEPNCEDIESWVHEFVEVAIQKIIMKETKENVFIRLTQEYKEIDGEIYERYTDLPLAHIMTAMVTHSYIVCSDCVSRIDNEDYDKYLANFPTREILRYPLINNISIHP